MIGISMLTAFSFQTLIFVYFNRKIIKSGDNILPEAANIIRADPLDDIETMLVNLSNQLDLMLENDNHND
jgi:hypothetical protein